MQRLAKARVTAGLRSKAIKRLFFAVACLLLIAAAQRLTTGTAIGIVRNLRRRCVYAPA